MHDLAIGFFRLLSVVFTIGWIGCLLTIPLAAFKFLAVLFEKDQPEENPQFVPVPRQ